MLLKARGTLTKYKVQKDEQLGKYIHCLKDNKEALLCLNVLFARFSISEIQDHSFCVV